MVRLSYLETDAFLHGEGSTVNPRVWTKGLEHFGQEGLYKGQSTCNVIVIIIM